MGQQPNAASNPISAGETHRREFRDPLAAVARVATNRIAIGSGLLLALQAKHSPTAQHCVRVAQNISAWGLYHKAPPGPLVEFELVGLLHDIGKIGVPDRLLFKDEGLTSEERALLSLHPQIGAEIIRSSGASPSVVNTISRLGEWHDGTNRRHGDGPLPLAARILAVADAFDAMITEQPYRKAMTLDSAVAELRRMAGRQFDPRVVESFIVVATDFDQDLSDAVIERWEDHGFQNQAVHLFQYDPVVNYAGLAADQIDLIFHRRLIDHMNDALVFVDTEGKIIDWNRSAETISGRSRSVLRHHMWSPELLGLQTDDQQVLNIDSCPLLGVLRTKRFDVRRLSFKHRDGSRRIIQVQLMPINDDRGVLRGAAMLIDDITRQKNLETAVAQLHQRATLDPLTKLYNRSELNVQLKKFEQLAAAGSTPVSVIICDIDYFKRINDTYSHAAGDEALIIFAEVLRQTARSTDVVARYGGEEFVILCGDCQAADAVAKAEAIRAALAQTPIPVLRGKCLTASFGVAQLVGDADGDAAIERADQALLLAKQNGRNRVELAAQIAENAAAHGTPTGQFFMGSLWSNWLGRGRPVRCTYDLLIDVPRELLFGKVHGFLTDWHAEVLDVTADSFVVRLDLRHVPHLVGEKNRQHLFGLSAQIFEADYLPSDPRQQAKGHLLLRVTLETPRSRERRSAAVEDAMADVIAGLNHYVVGRLVDDQLRPGIRIHQRR